MDVYLKIHNGAGQQVIAVCDKECLGLKLGQDRFKYHVKEGFFGGEIISVEEAIKILRTATNLNAVGPNIIKALIDEKIIHPEGVVVIDKIPIALKFIF